MDKEKRTSALRAAMHVASAPSNGSTGTRKRPVRKAPKRRLPEEPEEDSSLDKPSAVESVTLEGARPKFLQPSLVTGGKLKEYQLEGVEWMVSLDKNGVSGILGASSVSNQLSAWLRRVRSGRDGVGKGEFASTRLALSLKQPTDAPSHRIQRASPRAGTLQALLDRLSA